MNEITLTLDDLRLLLTGASGPAVSRLPDHHPETLAQAYLPEEIAFTVNGSAHVYHASSHYAFFPANEAANRGRVLDLSHRSTLHATWAALALRCGRDPSDGVIWRNRRAGWELLAGHALILAFAEPGCQLERFVYVPGIAQIADTPWGTSWGALGRAALVLAVKHVLAHGPEEISLGEALDRKRAQRTPD